MLPIKINFFIALKSIQNAQTFDHANGLSKYVYKYVGKFNEGNYIILYQNIHTSKQIIRKSHLHSIKIMWIKINKDKAYKNNRRKNYLRACDIHYFKKY